MSVGFCLVAMSVSGVAEWAGVGGQTAESPFAARPLGNPAAADSRRVVSAFDVERLALPARLELVAGFDRPVGLRIAADGTGASSPVVVDPLIKTQAAKLTASDGAAGDRFGWSVSISGDTVVVGARLDDDAGSGSGSAYVFERNAGGANAWGEVAKLTAWDADENDEFGIAVSVSGDTVVVGAHFDDDMGASSGAAYVFERNEGGAGAWGEMAKLTAADAAAGDLFGRAVAIGGDTIVVGAYGDDDAGSASGSAYVFERNAGGADAWEEVAKLTAADAAENENFGYSVSINGNTVVVGAYGDYSTGSTAGSAYVFERDAGGVDSWGEVAKLVASDAEPGDLFGWAVSIVGDTVAVGAPTADNPRNDSGSAYVFERHAGGAGVWGEVAELTAADAAASDYFGTSVSTSGDSVVVGAFLTDDSALSSGSAYVFDRNFGGANTWSEVAKLTATDAADSDYFGYFVSISGEAVVIGAISDDDAGVDSGSAYMFLRSVCGNGQPEAHEECDDGNLTDGDGCSATCEVCADGDGDGFGSPGNVACSSGPAVDCHDGDPRVHHGADEVNDGQDNQCPGDAGHGIVDELAPTLRFGSTVQLCWDDQPGATAYQRVSATNAGFTGVCSTLVTEATCSEIAVDPSPGMIWYLLVRPAEPYAGSWGLGAGFVERSLLCTR